jgi:5,6-dimethylbenzimidazole synthase
MPETLRYSVVAAVQTLWLAARAEELGLGWVSILEPDIIHRVLELPQTWALVVYLCIGWPVEEHLDPELDRLRWQQRLMSRAVESAAKILSNRAISGSRSRRPA